MDFIFKYKESGSVYRIYFSIEGLCLSPFKKYSAIVMFGQCISWCEEGVGKLDYKIPVSLDQHTYMVLVNLNCWDLLTILEADHNHEDELLELCYPPVKNELSDDLGED